MGALTDIKYEKGTTGSSYGNSVYFPDSTTSYIQALRNAAKPKQTTVNNATNPGYSSLSPAQLAGLLNANGGWGGLGAVGGTAASSTPFGSPYGYAVARTNVSAPGSALYRPGSVNIAPTPIPKIAVNPGQMAYKGGGNIDHAYGQAATSDWGINAAAESQVQLIKDWMVNELIPAAREQEIARGMARSGVAMELEADQTRVAALEADRVMSAAAAEQGRLNQEVTLQNAALALEREKADQSALLEYDKTASAWQQFVNDLSYRVQNSNAGWGLDYRKFDEDQRVNREAEILAGAQQSLDSWWKSQQASQGWTGLDNDAANNAANRSNALTIAGMQTGASGSNPVSEFEKDMPNLMADIAAAGREGPINASSWIQQMKASYPGVNPMAYSEIVRLLDMAARGSNVAGSLSYSGPSGATGAGYASLRRQ
jgi:hypothetical protein